MIIKKSEKNPKKYTIKMSKKEWIAIGKEGNWLKISDLYSTPMSYKNLQYNLKQLEQKQLTVKDGNQFFNVLERMVNYSKYAYKLLVSRILTKDIDEDLYYEALNNALDAGYLDSLFNNGVISREDYKFYKEKIGNTKPSKSSFDEYNELNFDN